MATKPKIKTLTNSSVDILNAIRNSASTDYRNYVPIATADAESIREIGAVLMDAPNLQNEFLTALVNRIGKVIITSKLYQNPIAMFKKGKLDLGETVEEIFVELAKPFQYDDDSETMLKKETPDVRSAFHVMNYQKYYKNTVVPHEMEMAFTSMEGVTDLLTKIIERLYTSANYDEFQVMKYLLAKKIVRGELYPAEVGIATDAETLKDNTAVIKAISNKFEFMTDKYNLAHVHTTCGKQEQYLLIDANYDAKVDVNVLASAFNMDKAEFLGHKVVIDGFGNLDEDRLAKLFADDTTYTPLTTAEKTALAEVPAVLVDGDFFQIYDKLIQFTSFQNGETLGQQNWFHNWKVFSASPFADACVFVPTAPAVTSVELAPTAITIAKGQSATVKATVKTTGFAPQAVTYTSNSAKVTVNASGLITVASDASGTAVITATSVYDASKKATCTVTVQ